MLKISRLSGGHQYNLRVDLALRLLDSRKYFWVLVLVGARVRLECLSCLDS